MLPAPLVAPPLANDAGDAVIGTNVPFEPVLHVRSLTGLVERASAPLPVHVAVVAFTDNDQVRFAETVNVGPVKATNPDGVRS